MDQRTVRINDRIRAKEVRVIDDDGSQLGIMPPAQALMIAEERGLDLVEIAPTATPPVCRIMNSGKFFYQQAKRESEARKHQRHIQVKEVKFRVKIDEHDFQFKKRNVERFLKEGNKVKSTVIFRGREAVHSEIGRKILIRLADELGEVALVEVTPRQEGMTMVQILSPKKDFSLVKPGKGDGKPAKSAEAKAAKAEKAPKAPKAPRAPKAEPSPAPAEAAAKE
ncbi:MAG: translation initiation factor IF-3 [Vicinamibacteria bacterium]